MVFGLQNFMRFTGFFWHCMMSTWFVLSSIRKRLSLRSLTNQAMRSPLHTTNCLSFFEQIFLAVCQIVAYQFLPRHTERDKTVSFLHEPHRYGIFYFVQVHAHRILASRYRKMPVIMHPTDEERKVLCYFHTSFQWKDMAQTLILLVFTAKHKRFFCPEAIEIHGFHKLFRNCHPSG